MDHSGAWNLKEYIECENGIELQKTTQPPVLTSVFEVRDTSETFENTGF